MLPNPNPGPLYSQRKFHRFQEPVCEYLTDKQQKSDLCSASRPLEEKGPQGEDYLMFSVL